MQPKLMTTTSLHALNGMLMRGSNTIDAKPNIANIYTGFIVFAITKSFV